MIRKNNRREYEVGIDGRKDVAGHVSELTDFIAALAAQWKRARPKVIKEPLGGMPVALIPIEMVCLLDEAADILVCDEEGCLRPVHKDWDFCKQHGEKK